MAAVRGGDSGVREELAEMNRSDWGSRGRGPNACGKAARAESSLVPVEQHLTQGNENDDADDRRKKDGRKG
jgi:hypothetical protein